MSAALLLLAALLAPALARRWSGDVVPPPAIAAAAWCGTLGLFSLHLLPYRPLRPATMWCLAATVAILSGASAASAAWMAGRRAAAVPRPRRPLPSTWWVAAYAAIGIAGTAWFVSEVFRVLGPDGFANAERLRFTLATYRIPSTFLFAQLFSIAAPLLTLALVLGGARPPWPLLVLGFGCAAGTVISTDRTQSFLLMASAAFMAAYRFGPALSLGRTAAGAGAVAVILLVAFLGVEAWVRKSPERMGLFLALPGMTWTPGEGAAGPGTEGLGPVAGRAAQRLAGLYVYATGSYAALDVLLADPPPRTGGAHTFFPVVRLLQRAGLVGGPVPSPIPDFVTLYPEPAPGLAALQFNAFTFLYYPLVDFGIAGALAYALVVGIGCGLVYGWMRRDRADPLRLLVAGQVATALAMTVFVNKFNNTAWWYVLCLTVLPWIAGPVGRALLARPGGAGAGRRPR